MARLRLIFCRLIISKTAFLLLPSLARRLAASSMRASLALAVKSALFFSSLPALLPCYFCLSAFLLVPAGRHNAPAMPRELAASLAFCSTFLLQSVFPLCNCLSTSLAWLPSQGSHFRGNPVCSRPEDPWLHRLGSLAGQPSFSCWLSCLLLWSLKQPLFTPAGVSKLLPLLRPLSL